MEESLNQENVPPLHPQPVQPVESRLSSKGLMIGIVVALIVLIGAGAFIIVSKSNQKNRTTTITTPTPTPDPTANWKTYTNTKYGYSVKIPQDWQIDTQGGADQSTFITPYLDSPCNYEDGTLCSSILISAAAPSNESENIVSNKKEVIVGGESSEAYESFDPNYGYPPTGRLQYVVKLKHNGNDYSFHYEESQKDKQFKTAADWQDKKTFDQILSTFKFTDQNSVDTSTWKTYSENNNAYTIKYPNDWSKSLSDSINVNMNPRNGKMDLTLKGPQGEIILGLLDQYGGACPPPWEYEKFTFGNLTIDEVCYGIDQDNGNVEIWNGYKEINLKTHIGIWVVARASSPTQKNRDTILQILSTLEINQQNF